MAKSPTIPYLDLTLANFKELLSPTEKGKTLVLMIGTGEFKVVGTNLVPLKKGESGLFQKIPFNGTIQTAKLLFKRNVGENLKVFLADSFLYEVVNGIPIKIAKAV